MMRGILLSVLLLCLPAWAQAATYYINDAGSDANAGTSRVAPWLTWEHAFSNSDCGDTLIVMDGTYTTATHGNPSIKKACTASTVYTIRSQNQRVALISGSGTAASFAVLNAAYIMLDGLRIKSTDNTTGINDSAPIRIRKSNHITVKNGLLYENNRYFNTALFGVFDSSNILVEDVELYSFHRHGLSINNTPFLVARRVYCHSRNRADIPGGFPSGVTTHGDGCVAVYPSSDNILENVIAENTLEIAEVNASNEVSQGRRNQILGSVALGTASFPSSRGIIFDARGNTTAGQPQDNVVRDVVVITTNSNHGIQSRGSKNTQVYNSTVIGSDNNGFAAFQQGFTGGGDNSFFCTNCLALNNATNGFFINTTDTPTFKLNYPNAFGNGTAFSPLASNPNITNELTRNPVMGTCYLWLPDASPLKGAGVAGADIGATILYRYKNGVLTNVPLWNPKTGEFPHGALVAGVNDVAGISLFDVHKRLNVNTNGCSFPANYGDGITDADAPSTPAGLRIF